MRFEDVDSHEFVDFEEDDRRQSQQFVVVPGEWARIQYRNRR